MKYILISNRLPITASMKGGKLRISRSGGGLATGLDSLETNAEKHWIGWAGVHAEEEGLRQKLIARLKKQQLHPVFLSPEHIQDYYEGYSNSTLWPLCHCFFSYVVCKDKYWKAYKEVNERFCEEALKVMEPGDAVWIHDYQLMLLPAMIRERMPGAAICYFHHIPFPTYEMFRYLPERAELLRGLLGADLVAFHTHDYMRHFISALYRALNLECRLDEVQLESRVARIDAFPMGINYDLYHDAAIMSKTRSFAHELRRIAGTSKVILSVDRLDYSKGILLRLESFASFLENNPEYRGKVTMLMVVVPSRDTVDKYADLKIKVDQAVGAINGRYAAVGWTPVHYFYRSFSLPELVSMYNIADIALVTPLRDGMNLVAKEYLAAKRDRPGVLILSEMAGAAEELRDALVVNPMNTKQIAEAILTAVTMPEEEQLRALRKMQKSLSRRTVKRWASEFFKELESVKRRNDELAAKHLAKEDLQHILMTYSNTKRRLLVLDYDGTLVPFAKEPTLARPTAALREILGTLASDRYNTVLVCSGRDKQTLEDWLGGLGVALSAEHGAFFLENGVWRGAVQGPLWTKEILDVLERIRDKTPGSAIEAKETALVWHYRQVDSWLAELRISQLINALMVPCARLGLQIMKGNKIVEIKPADYNKGKEIQRRLERRDYDFLMAVGDDATDEDMFKALPPDAFTIKVGQVSDAARYMIAAQNRVLPFLSALASRSLAGRARS